MDIYVYLKKTLVPSGDRFLPVTSRDMKNAITGFAFLGEILGFRSFVIFRVVIGFGLDGKEVRFFPFIMIQRASL